MGIWERIRGKKPEQKPARIKPPAPSRTPARSYDSQPVMKTPQEYLRDGGDLDRRRRQAEDYDSTVDRLRRDREALARDNDQLRRDRETAWAGNMPSNMYYSPGYGDYLYRGDDVVDLTAGHHHHHHHDDAPEVVVVQTPAAPVYEQAYDQADDFQSHMQEDHEADQNAADEQADDQFYGSGSSQSDSTPAADTSWSSSGDSGTSSQDYGSNSSDSSSYGGE